ncbi:MAG: hypothetical protein LBV12_08685 [Puniceicoccales bacterium]|nr:hypothetical protein [Puniceicoccales bacterium]
MPETAIFLLDNGSLQPEAVFALRRLAGQVSSETGYHVEPVSLLHSNKIPTEHLNGSPAEIFSGALTRQYRAGIRRFLVAPLFFGPSGAIIRYLPERIRAFQEKLGPFTVHIVPWLASLKGNGNTRIAGMLADGVVSTMQGLVRPSVVLVDHGSPEAEVSEVRNHLAMLLRKRLGDRVQGVVAASMERRSGSEYDFNEPLLARALDNPEMEDQAIVVAMQFLLPGRHAGPGGDVAAICAEAKQRHPRQSTYMTPLVAGHPALVGLLADRIRGGLQADW